MPLRILLILTRLRSPQTIAFTGFWCVVHGCMVFLMGTSPLGLLPCGPFIPASSSKWRGGHENVTPDRCFLAMVRAFHPDQNNEIDSASWALRTLPSFSPMLFPSQGLHGIDGSGTSSGERGGDKSQQKHGDCSQYHDERIKRTYAKEKGAQ